MSVSSSTHVTVRSTLAADNLERQSENLERQSDNLDEQNDTWGGGESGERYSDCNTGETTDVISLKWSPYITLRYVNASPTTITTCTDSVQTDRKHPPCST